MPQLTKENSYYYSILSGLCLIKLDQGWNHAFPSPAKQKHRTIARKFDENLFYSCPTMIFSSPVIQFMLVFRSNFVLHTYTKPPISSFSYMENYIGTRLHLTISGNCTSRTTHSTVALYKCWIENENTKNGFIFFFLVCASVNCYPCHGILNTQHSTLIHIPSFVHSYFIHSISLLGAWIIMLWLWS